MWLGEGGQVYGALLASSPDVRVTGFEPIAEECDALNRRFGPAHVYLPHAVADGTTRPFYYCNYPMTSSLYEPDLAIMNRYEDLAEYCQVVSVEEITTVRLDDVPEVRGADYLKIDVQGAELEVLKGAVQVLRDILVVQAEVEFVPIYRGQPLFADVDQFLRSQGFQFHRFVNVEGRRVRSEPAGELGPAEWSQTLWADAVYIQDMGRWADLPADRLLQFATILHDLYGSSDLCARLLQVHDRKSGGELCKHYRSAGAEPSCAGDGG